MFTQQAPQNLNSQYKKFPKKKKDKIKIFIKRCITELSEVWFHNSTMYSESMHTVDKYPS